MEYLTVILVICSAPKFTDKKACEAKYTQCVDVLSERPAAKEHDLSKYDLAVHLLEEKNRKALCK